MGGVVRKLKIDQIRAALSKLSNVEFQLNFQLIFLPIFVSDQRKASLTVRLRKIFANLRVRLRSRATTKRHSAVRSRGGLQTCGATSRIRQETNGSNGERKSNNRGERGLNFRMSLPDRKKEVDALYTSPFQYISTHAHKDSIENALHSSKFV